MCFRGQILDEDIQHDPFMLLFRFMLIKPGNFLHRSVVALLITTVAFVEFFRCQTAMGVFGDGLAGKLCDNLDLSMQVFQFGIDACTVS